MRAHQEFRDRPDEEVAVLDALVDRADDGMTVFELRAAVDADIDAIEEALSRLKADGLIETERDDGTVQIRPAEKVVPDPEDAEEGTASMLDAVLDRLGL